MEWAAREDRLVSGPGPRLGFPVRARYQSWVTVTFRRPPSVALSTTRRMRVSCMPLPCTLGSRAKGRPHLPQTLSGRSLRSSVARQLGQITGPPRARS